MSNSGLEITNKDIEKELQELENKPFLERKDLDRIYELKRLLGNGASKYSGKKRCRYKYKGTRRR